MQPDDSSAEICSALTVFTQLAAQECPDSLGDGVPIALDCNISQSLSGEGGTG